MDCLLGIDLGTSYFKFVLVDRSGAERGASRIAVPTRGRLPGLQEIEPAELIAALHDGISESCERASVDSGSIRGVSYSSQANSFLLLDARGEPLTPIVLWSDHRVDEPGPAITALWQRADYLKTTGMSIRDRELAAAKIDWYRRCAPELWRRTERVLTISDFLSFLLTGRAVGDASTAALLGMWDIERGRWWPEALAALELDREQLATPLQPGAPGGETGGPAIGRLGLPAGIPFAVGSLDHYAAAVGAGLGYHADTSESTGTVLACIHLHPNRQPAPEYCTAPTAQDALFYRLAFGPNGARGLELLRERFDGEYSMDELSRLAALSPPGARGLRGPRLASQQSDLDSLVGAAKEYAPGDMARAVMESTALSLEQLVDASCPEGRPDRIVATGGGARSETWLQIKADLLGVEMLATGTVEPGCYGAALFASVAAGWHRNLNDAIAEFVAVRRSFLPDESIHTFYTGWKSASRQQTP